MPINNEPIVPALPILVNPGGAKDAEQIRIPVAQRWGFNQVGEMFGREAPQRSPLRVKGRAPQRRGRLRD
jgi:hypothetical protein